MSKELIGHHGHIVGSESYFRDLNERYFMANAMRDKNKYNYYDMLKDLASRVNRNIDAIYDDLKSNMKIIRCIPSDRRNSLQDFIEGCKSVCSLSSSSTGRADDCLSILKLYSSDTKPYSKASEAEIDSAISTLEKSNLVGSNDKLDVMKKVADQGVSNVSKKK